ncbi:MAG: S8 family serine peptidase, partial [Candidatus Mariimomonas ferrooxydans]
MKEQLRFFILLTGIFYLLTLFAFADTSEVYKIHTAIVEPSLSEKIKLIPQDTMVRVIITLIDQPYGAIKKDLEERYSTQIEDLRSSLESIRQTENSEEIKAVLKNITSLNNRIIFEAYNRAKEMVDEGQRAIVSQIEFLGEKVNYRYVIVNSISAIIPAEGIEGLSTLPEIALISEDRRMEANLNVSIPSVFADTWWNNGFTGGIFDAAIVDSGMDTAHPAFSGKTFVSSTFHTTGSTDPCYDDNPATTDDINGHGTHVGGIVMSQGALECPACRGVAYGLDKTFNLKAAWKNSCSGGASMYFSDAMAAVDWAESQGDSPDVYNLSYSGETASDDSAFARFWDAVVSMNGKPVSLSAGNSGPSNTNFNDPAISYNAVTVANINDYNNTDRSDDIIRNSSTRGPTASGRKKPDLSTLPQPSLT